MVLILLQNGIFLEDLKEVFVKSWDSGENQIQDVRLDNVVTLQVLCNKKILEDVLYYMNNTKIKNYNLLTAKKLFYP